jgi:hypothetical protein
MLHYRGCYECGLVPLDFTEASYVSISCVMSMLADCTSLTTLWIMLSYHHLFLNDQAGLEGFFSHDQKLESKSLESFSKSSSDATQSAQRGYRRSW